MADLSKIKVGDTLRFTGQVVEVLVEQSSSEVGAMLVAFEGGPNELYDGTVMTADEVEAAEHIPAPRTFKRGDRVKRRLDGGWEVGGLVLGGSRTDVGKLQGYLRVDWPGAGVAEHHPSLLEHCEAPNA